MSWAYVSWARAASGPPTAARRPRRWARSRRRRTRRSAAPDAHLGGPVADLLRRTRRRRSAGWAAAGRGRPRSPVSSRTSRTAAAGHFSPRSSLPLGRLQSSCRCRWTRPISSRPRRPASRRQIRHPAALHRRGWRRGRLIAGHRRSQCRQRLRETSGQIRASSTRVSSTASRCDGVQQTEGEAGGSGQPLLRRQRPHGVGGERGVLVLAEQLGDRARPARRAGAAGLPKTGSTASQA